LSDDPLLSTQTLLPALKRRWPLLGWVLEQFSLTSALTVAGVIVGLGGWALSLQTRVVVLETRVIPFVKDETRLQRLEDHDQEYARRLALLEAYDRQAVDAAKQNPQPDRRTHRR